MTVTEVVLEFSEVAQIKQMVSEKRSVLHISKKLGLSYEKALFAVSGITGEDPKRLMQRKNKGKGSRSMHGDPGKYNAGCRCGICRKAQAKRMVEAAADRKTRLHEAPHGTPSAYVNWGCRCDPCKKAGSENNKNITYTPPETQTRKWQRWEVPEEETVATYELTAKELALQTGRTTMGVHQRRRKVTRELAGVV